MIPEGLGVTDTKHYLGSMSHSLEHLPRWYQVVSLCAIFLVLYLRHNPLVAYIVVNLHTSFGTSSIWPPRYQKLLESMTFNERFGFTVYGVALGSLAAATYVFFCQDRYLGIQLSQILPNRKVHTALLAILLCICQAFSIRYIISIALDEKRPVHLALVDFDKYKQKHPKLPVENVHFTIQAELLKELTLRMLRQQVPVFLISTGYRIAVDLTQGQHCALRWYTATTAKVAIGVETLRLYFGNRHDVVSYSTILWCLSFLGVINYLYGPSRRAGSVKTLSASSSLRELIRGMLTSSLLFFLGSTIVLTVVVSVHVVELISVWLITSLLMVWTPAVVDSCSTEYIFFLTVLFGYCGYHMEVWDSKSATMLFVLLFSLMWVNYSLVYNVAVNLTKNRYAGLVVALWIAASILSASEAEREHLDGMDPTSDGRLAPFIYVVTNRIHYLAQLSSGQTLPPQALLSLWGDPSHVTYSGALSSMLLLTVVFTGINFFLGRFRSPKQKEEMQMYNIPLLTPNILFRKLIHTFVLSVLVGFSFLLGFVFFRYYIFPRITVFKTLLMVPDLFFNVASLGIFCTILGTLMDVRKTLYDGCLRVFSMMEPPGENDSEDDVVQSPK